jgi:uncharacterized membrane protein
MRSRTSHPLARPIRLGAGMALPSAVVIAAACVTLSAGVVLKGDCFGHGGDFWRSRLCYTDITVLYHARGIDRNTFPYVHATLSASGHGAHGFNEYPVLTGVFMWAAGLPVASASAYLTLTIALLAMASLATTWMLWAMAGPRALYWAASPVLAVYAFQNWDLLAVAAATAGMLLWSRGRPYGAAVAFGVGAAFKLYPILLVVPIALERLARGERREAVRLAAAAGGTWAIVNLPFVVANSRGWWETYRFHAQRAAGTSGTIWSQLDTHPGTSTVNRVSAIALVAVWIAMAVVVHRRRGDGRYPVLELSAAMVAAFVVLNKVSSPQYVLWVLPFFALVAAGRAWWWPLSVVCVARYLAEFGVNVVGFGAGTADHVMRAAIVLQAIVLAVYACDVIWLRAQPRFRSA